MSVKRECSSFSFDVSLTYLCTPRSLKRKTGDNGQHSFVSDYFRSQSIGLLTTVLFAAYEICYALDMRGTSQNPSSKPYHYENLQSFSSFNGF